MSNPERSLDAATNKTGETKSLAENMPEISGTSKQPPEPPVLTIKNFSQLALAALDANDGNKDGYFGLDELRAGIKGAGKAADRSVMKVIESNERSLSLLNDDETLVETTVHKEDLKKFAELEKRNQTMLDKTSEARKFLLSNFETVNTDRFGGMKDSYLSSTEIENYYKKNSAALPDNVKTSMQSLIASLDTIMEDLPRTASASRPSGLSREALADPSSRVIKGIERDLETENMFNQVIYLNDLQLDPKALTDSQLSRALDNLQSNKEVRAIADRFKSALLTGDLSAFKDTFVKSQSDPHFQSSIDLLNKALDSARSSARLAITSDKNLVLHLQQSPEPGSMTAGVAIAPDGTITVPPVITDKNGTRAAVLKGEVLGETPASAFKDLSTSVEQTMVDVTRQTILKLANDVRMRKPQTTFKLSF